MTDADALDTALEELVDAAGAFSKIAVTDFRESAPAAFKTFSQAFCASLVTLQIEVVLIADGSASCARVVAVAADGRKTTLASIS